MGLLKKLAEVSKEEQMNFLNSFDQVLCDMGGVIWLSDNPIVGSAECTQNLQKLGKKVRYVTNNTLKSADDITKDLNDMDFIATLDDIVHPIQTTINCLKNLNVDKELYVIGTKPIKKALREAGYNLVPDPPVPIEEKVSAILEQYDSHSHVGAVILDEDMNINYIKLQKAYWYLQDPNCKFIVTIRDKATPVAPNQAILGPYYFSEALKDFSGRKYIEMGKPSLSCVNYIKEKYNITNPNRILLIGDSIQTDMSVGAIGGFQKMLVLSGVTTMNDVRNWQYPEECKPEYYVEDLSVLNDIIKSIFVHL